MPQPQKEKMTRTVKIGDDIHHKIRVLSVTHRMPMQDFVERMLKYGLQTKAWQSFKDEAAIAAPAR